MLNDRAACSVPLADDPGAAAPDANPFLAIVEDIATILADDRDHPEVWRALAAAAEHDVSDLFALLGQLRAGSTGRGLKTVTLIGGILHAIAVDRAAGLAVLDRLLPAYPHCPQVAGAIFFVGRHGQPRPSADLTGRFCDAPFVKFETLMDGTVAPCCSIWTQQRLGQLDGQTAAQIWNSPAAQAMRSSILDGSYGYCNKLRCSLITDDVLPKADAITDPALRTIIDEQRVVLDSGPSWVFLAHDVTCNLSCPSCRDRILAADEAQERRFDVIERDVLQPLLHAQEPVRLSLSGQGDPWSSPHYRSILRHVADHDLNVELEIHTNALLMSEKRWADYAGWRNTARWSTSRSTPARRGCSRRCAGRPDGRDCCQICSSSPRSARAGSSASSISMRRSSSTITTKCPRWCVSR